MKRLTVAVFLAAALVLVAGVSAQTLKEVPRNQTLVLGWSIASPIGVTNPWAVPGYTHQEGNVFMWEALYYFAIFADKEIPWLAQSMKYTQGLHRAHHQDEPQGHVERRRPRDLQGRGLHLRRADEE